MSNSHFRRAWVVAAMMALAVCPKFSRADEAPRAAAAGAKVTFLDLEAAKKAIVDDSADPYFARLSPTEMSVKTGSKITGDTPEARLKECKARYRAACVAFTEDEQRMISAVVADLAPILAKEVPTFAEQPWSFLKVKPTLEGGMPHTRGGHIVLPVPIVEILRRMEGLKPAGGPLAAVFVHEQAHVVERAKPERFAKLFTGVLGFQKAKQPTKFDPWIAARHVVNPDGPDVSWVMPIKLADGSTRWVWPLLLLSGPDATTFRGMQRVAIDVQPDGKGSFSVKLGADGVPIHEPLDAVEEYGKAVRAKQNSYHPNEIAAELLPRVLLQADEGDADDLKDVRAWAAEAFAKPKPATAPATKR